MQLNSKTRVSTLIQPLKGIVQFMSVSTQTTFNIQFRLSPIQECIIIEGM